MTNPTNSQGLEGEEPPKFKLYLQAKSMRDDDRSYQYIANKLGFKNASSIHSLLNTYGWVSNYLEAELTKAKEQARQEAERALAEKLKYDMENKLRCISTLGVPRIDDGVYFKQEGLWEWIEEVSGKIGEHEK